MIFGNLTGKVCGAVTLVPAIFSVVVPSAVTIFPNEIATPLSDDVTSFFNTTGLDCNMVGRIGCCCCCWGDGVTSKVGGAEGCPTSFNPRGIGPLMVWHCKIVFFLILNNFDFVVCIASFHEYIKHKKLITLTKRTFNANHFFEPLCRNFLEVCISKITI